MKTLFTFAFLFLGLYSTAQKLDYRKMRDTICPPICGWRDSLSLTEIIPNMLAVDTNLLTRKSISRFYEDFASVEYQLFAYTLDSACMENSAKYSAMAAYHDPKNYSANWNAAYSYGVIHDCEKMRLYLDRYLEGIPKKYHNEGSKEQVGFLRARCE